MKYFVSLRTVGDFDWNLKYMEGLCESEECICVFVKLVDCCGYTTISLSVIILRFSAGL